MDKTKEKVRKIIKESFEANMKIISWNINGLKSFYKQEKKMVFLIDMIKTHDADIVFFQEKQSFSVENHPFLH